MFEDLCSTLVVYRNEGLNNVTLGSWIARQSTLLLIDRWLIMEGRLMTFAYYGNLLARFLSDERRRRTRLSQAGSDLAPRGYPIS